MTRCSFVSALTAVLFLALPALADSPPVEDPSSAEASSPAMAEEPVAAAELGWDQFDDPDFDPAALPEAKTPVEPVAVERPTTTAADEPSDAEILGSIPDAPDAGSRIHLDAQQAASVPRESHGVILGPRGVDDLGRAGRLHTVARGDTLWDLSAAYLGTPWVWPSVWIDNDDIANPHLILPGNKIWITANEMRIVTDAEAEAFLNPVAESDGTDEAPLAMEEGAPVAALEADEPDAEPSTLEAFPIAMGDAAQASLSGRRITVVRREAMGFVSAEDFEGASSIVDSPVERTFLAEGDEIVVGIGEGDVAVGDQFAIFSALEEVRDPKTRRLLGHHVEPLGWAEIKALTGDTSIGEIRESYSEIARGARMVRRDPLPPSVEVQITPDVIEGRIVFLPSERALMADGGYVYLDRGEFHGVEMGSELEAFDSGKIVEDRARSVDVRTPDQVIAKMVVVSVEPDSSVAFVIWSTRELVVGDSIRPVVPTLAQR
jgi:hypothetical protein